MWRDEVAALVEVESSRTEGEARASRVAWRRMAPPAIVAGLTAIVVLLYLTLLLDDTSITWLIREEHPIEAAGALSLLAAGVACLVLWRRVSGDLRWPTLRRFSLLPLAALFVFGFGEEVSWGQRIFGVGTPESIEAANKQGELNLHNLQVFGTLNPDSLFQLFWLLLGVVVPLCALWPRARRTLQRFVPVLPVALAPLFILNQLLTSGFAELFERQPDLFNSSTFDPDFTIFEIKETAACLLLAAGFWLLVRGWRAEPGGREA